MKYNELDLVIQREKSNEDCLFSLLTTGAGYLLIKCDRVQIFLVNLALPPYDALISRRCVEDMLTSFFRALVFVICVGAAAFAHADSSQTGAGMHSSANITQQFVTTTSVGAVTQNVLHHHTDFENTQSRLSAVDNLMVGELSHLPAPKPVPKHSTQKRQFDPALADSSRMANLLRHDPEEVQPFYQLAIELPVEPAPCMAKGYSVDFNETLNWMLTINPPSSRLSGWKESNLNFTVYQHHLHRA